MKWCKARPEQEGKPPVYYTDDAQTVVYRPENVNVTNVQAKWTANEYRLPTEAEWEKAGQERDERRLTAERQWSG